MAVGMCLLYKLTDERFGRTIARRTVLFLSISPLAFVFSAVYAESLFLVLATGTFLLAERRRFVGASVLGALGVLTRPVGLALAPALIWMAWGEREGRWRRAAADRAAARRRGAASCSTCGGRRAILSRRRTPRRAAGDAASGCRRS